MIIFGSENEINDVVHFFRPDYPEQHFNSIEEECCYIFHGVPVEIHLIPNGSEYAFTDLAHTLIKLVKDKKAEEMKDAPV